MTDIDVALRPEISLGRIRGRDRPLSNRELHQRGRALCGVYGNTWAPSCSGNVFIGLFFDGTGKNEDEDCKKHEHNPRHHKHSDVVRLYHAHPDRKKVGTNADYRYYSRHSRFEEFGSWIF